MEDLTTREQAENKLIDMIVEHLQTGKKFPTENQLIKDLEISRTTLRELLSYYKATGIITSQQGSGRYIEMPDISKQIANTWRILVRAKPSLLMDFLEVRSILELNSLGKAMQRIDLEQLQYMGEQVRIMKEKAEMGQAFVEQDGEFHKTLFRVTGNVFLEQLLTAFWELFADSPIEKNHEDLTTVAYQHGKNIGSLYPTKSSCSRRFNERTI